jgi:mono/diheme cytochrome c family protein
VTRSHRGIAARASILAAALAALLGVVVGIAGAAGEDGQATFEQSCKSCHTIGGGDGIGPDLAGLADRREPDWVRAFILAPDDVIASGDPIAKELLDKYGAPMPNLGLTEAQADALLAFLGFTTPTPTTPTETTPTETTPTETTPAGEGDVADGKELFTGAGRFAEGGPSCLSCHSVAGIGALGGGQLGPDLTGAYEKYGGAKGLDAVLESVAFPTMAPIFSSKPLTAEERADLVAFLAAAPDKERPADAARNLVVLSGMVVIGLGAIGLGVWRRRLGGVRKPLVNRQRGK